MLTNVLAYFFDISPKGPVFNGIKLDETVFGTVEVAKRTLPQKKETQPYLPIFMSNLSVQWVIDPPSSLEELFLSALKAGLLTLVEIEALKRVKVWGAGIAFYFIARGLTQVSAKYQGCSDHHEFLCNLGTEISAVQQNETLPALPIPHCLYPYNTTDFITNSTIHYFQVRSWNMLFCYLSHESSSIYEWTGIVKGYEKELIAQMEFGNWTLTSTRQFVNATLPNLPSACLNTTTEALHALIQTFLSNLKNGTSSLSSQWNQLLTSIRGYEWFPYRSEPMCTPAPDLIPNWLIPIAGVAAFAGVAFTVFLIKRKCPELKQLCSSSPAPQANSSSSSSGSQSPHSSRSSSDNDEEAQP